jgi:hypothetical protein
MTDTTVTLLSIVAPVISAVLVAILNNWEKINPGKKRTKETLKVVNELSDDMKGMKVGMDRMQSAQRTSLQTQILEKCKVIQLSVKDGEIDYSEELKQLIILYREYHLCGFNSQGKLYFNDTIQMVSEHNNVLVRELMNTLFPEYEP